MLDVERWHRAFYLGLPVAALLPGRFTAATNFDNLRFPESKPLAACISKETIVL
jgi:hypothetical protein